jgi:hypothetical protein
MRKLLGVALAAAMLVPAASALAQDLVFMLDNQSSYDIYEFYASPSNVGDWEEDILGMEILASGESSRITIADGRSQCEYDILVVFEDGLPALLRILSVGGADVTQALAQGLGISRDEVEKLRWEERLSWPGASTVQSTIQPVAEALAELGKLPMYGMPTRVRN